MMVGTVRALALKIASYGVMHLVVAIAVAYALTRDWSQALAIGLVEPIFQTIAFAVHDRVWHGIERRGRLGVMQESREAVGGRVGLHDHHAHAHVLPTGTRTLALKSLTYAVMHFSVAVMVAFALTRDWRIALAVGLVEPLVQTVFFTVHDRIWARIERRRAITPV